MILSMINIDPKERKNIEYYLKLASKSIDEEGFPDSFSKLLYPVCSNIMQPEFVSEDDKIGLISRSIIKTNNSLNPIVFQKVKRKDSIEEKAKSKFMSSLIPIEEKEEEKESKLN